MQLDNRIEVLVLQHPQEPGETRGSARLVPDVLKNVQIRVGLSWPNFEKALGRKAEAKRWAVLYLGSGIKADEGSVLPALEGLYGALTFVDKKGRPLALPASDIEGVVVLDGTWSQAKTLWWRNAWLLKLRRAILQPKMESLYGVRRKEPRKECVSTIESIGVMLSALGEPKEIAEALFAAFRDFLKR